MAKYFIPFLILTIWILSGIYFGFSGLTYLEYKQLEKETIEYDLSNPEIDTTNVITYNGSGYRTQRHLDKMFYQRMIVKYFNWIDNFPNILILVLCASGMGAVGGSIRIIKQISYENMLLTESKYISIPLIGFLLGVVVLATFYLFPSFILSTNKFEIQPYSLMFFSLFAGMFSKRFLDWLDIRFNDLLEKNDKQIKQ